MRRIFLGRYEDSNADSFWAASRWMVGEEPVLHDGSQEGPGLLR